MTLRMGHSKFYIISMSLIVFACSGLFYAGYWLGQNNNQTPYIAADGSRVNFADAAARTRKVEDEAQRYLLQLSRQLGILKARVVRVEVFAQDMTEVTNKFANVAIKKYDFNSAPAQGGPAKSVTGPIKPLDKNKLRSDINRVTRKLERPEVALAALSTFMLHANLRKQGKPEGQPIAKNKGWMSSSFGARRDPFTGRRTFHDGIDFAAPLGTPIHTVAAGVVSASGARGGYGNTVEIDHGDGLVSRYAHNSRLLVKVGDRVRKGQKIALMGSTGRSTGSHVHYEILRHGKPISPHAFMRRLKK